MREGIREVKGTAILIKRTFSISVFFGSSLVRPCFLLGLQPERIWVGVREGNLNKSAFCAKCRRCRFVMSPKGEVVAAELR